MTGPLEIFFSYAHKDKVLMNAVRRQLVVYERNKRIFKWHDRMIPTGTEWRDQIDRHIEDARIILLFMSPHFIESRYCYEVEGEIALRRQKSGDARVIPIILRPCAWEETPFGELQALPVNGEPISLSEDCDEVCLNVARGIMLVVDELTKIGPPMIDHMDVPTQTTSNPENGTKLLYCKRCGQESGIKSICTGTFTHHDFIFGAEHNYCERCGVLPGNKSTCTGTYTHHSFVSYKSSSVHCSRCGALIGEKSICTGTYTHHDFHEI